LASITLVERLRSGENHVVHRVSYVDPKGDGRDVVVRAGSEDDAARARARSESMAMRKVAGVAGPEMYDFRPEYPGFAGPVTCMQFIAGRQCELNRVGQQQMQRLGGVVQRLHSLSIDDLTGCAPSNLSLSGYAEERWHAHLASRLPSIRDPLSRALQGRLRAAVSLVGDAMGQLTAGAGTGTAESLVLLHADISGANVIWGPQPVLIDWEYARVGDPADEVGYLFTQNTLSDADRAAFWRGYGAAISAPRLDQIIHRVGLWEPMTLLGSVMWWLDAWSRLETPATAQGDPTPPRTAGYYLQQAMERLDRFDQMFGGTNSRRY
jgi:thiamine kinase-like enzyme